MAKILLLSVLVAIAVAQAVAAAPVQLSPAAKKSIDELNLKLQKLVEVVVAAATPATQPEARHAALTHLRTAEVTLAKARETGNEKKIAELVLSFDIAASLVKNAPPAEKLKVMEEGFNSAAGPNPLDCPTVDKPYCEMHSKVQKAFEGVVAAAPPKKKLEVKGAVLQKTMHTAVKTINKAYAGGDEKKIAQVLATYSKAADAVIAAAPAEKLKLMEETFEAAAVARPGATA